MVVDASLGGVTVQLGTKVSEQTLSEVPLVDNTHWNAVLTVNHSCGLTNSVQDLSEHVHWSVMRINNL